MPQVSGRDEVGRDDRDECAVRMRMVYWVYRSFRIEFSIMLFREASFASLLHHC